MSECDVVSLGSCVLAGMERCLGRAGVAVGPVSGRKEAVGCEEREGGGCAHRVARWYVCRGKRGGRLTGV